MTNLRFKKMSVLLGVSAIALATLSATPTLSGYSYVQGTSEFTGTSSSDVDTTPYSYTSVVLKDSNESGSSFYMENVFEFADTDDAAPLSVDDVYASYDLEADEFGNSYGMQFGKSYMNFTGAYNYTAGDMLSEEIEDWSETWNLQVKAPVVSNEDMVLNVTPFVVFGMGSSDSGVGVIAKYNATDSAISEAQGTYYYDATNSASKIGAGVVGNLGLDFGLAGNFNISDTSDFEVSTYMTKSFDETSLLFEVLYANSDYYVSSTNTYAGSVLRLRPEVDYTLSDSTTITAYTAATFNLDNSNDISYDAELYVTTYLAEDLYVRPYIISNFDDSVSLRLRVYKSF